jgi:hypothetical protein
VTGLSSIVHGHEVYVLADAPRHMTLHR